MRGLLKLLNLQFKADSPGNVYFIMVPPEKISHIKVFRLDDLPVLGPNAVTGQLDGTWDRMKVPFRMHYVYRTIAGRILKKKAWHLTPLNRKRRSHRNSEEIEKENTEIDRLIGSIQAKGYLSNYELGNRDIDKDWFELNQRMVPPELIVGMDRSGRLFQLANGRHRLAIAQVLGLSEIPAILSVYHKTSIGNLPTKRRLITGDKADFRPF